MLLRLVLACDDPTARHRPGDAGTVPVPTVDVDPACVSVERSATFEGPGGIREDWAPRLDGTGPVRVDLPGTLTLSGRWPSSLVVAADVIVVGAGADCTLLTGEGVRQAVVVEGAPALTLAHLTVEAGEGEDGGGLAAPTGGTLAIEDVVFRGNHARHQGAGLFAEGEGSVALVDVTFDDNDADSAGGALFVRGPQLAAVRGVVAGNRAGTDGAGFRIHGSTATIDGTSFDGNRSDDRGGALSVDSGAFVTGTGLAMTGNSAASRGGAVWVDDGARLDLVGCDVRANDATEGGGIAARDEAAVLLVDSVVGSNAAVQEGGGLHVVEAATVAVDGGAIEGNGAFDGGGLWVDLGAAAVLDGVAVTDNVAVGFGGGLATSAGGTIQVHGGSVERNEAGEGGGAFVGSGSVACDGGAAWCRTGRTRAAPPWCSRAGCPRPAATSASTRATTRRPTSDSW